MGQADYNYRGNYRGDPPRREGRAGDEWRDRDYPRESGSRDDRFREGGSREHRTYRYTDDDLPVDETGRLISSRKVEGTAVYDRNGHRLGSIHNFMVDKRSGQVSYAVLTFGGFLGMGGYYYPLPWRMLNYDTELGGYQVEMDEEDLENAPNFRMGEEPRFDERYESRIYGYYGLPF